MLEGVLERLLLKLFGEYVEVSRRPLHSSSAVAASPSLACSSSLSHVADCVGVQEFNRDQLHVSMSVACALRAYCVVLRSVSTQRMLTLHSARALVPAGPAMWC